MNYSTLATPAIVKKTIAALKKNGISAEFVKTADEAKAKVLSLIPAGAEVMTMTSITLEQTGLTSELNDSGKYISVKNKLMNPDRDQDANQLQKMGAAPEWVVGSVHAVTENGEVIVVSNTGSQLPAYAYGAQHVVWVASTKKIAANIEAGLKRIREHIVPQESVRARKAYGLPNEWHTFVSKVLIFNREVNPDRIQLILVGEDLGF
jgi:hypothetical protein